MLQCSWLSVKIKQDMQGFTNTTKVCNHLYFLIVTCYFCKPVVDTVSILCESFDFSRFVDNFPDFPPISLPYFPILRKLNNFTLWNFHMVCKCPCRQRLLSAQASRCLEFSFSRDRVLLRCWAFLALKYEEPLINVFLASYFCIRGA